MVRVEPKMSFLDGQPSVSTVGTTGQGNFACRYKFSRLPEKMHVLPSRSDAQKAVDTN